MSIFLTEPKRTNGDREVGLVWVLGDTLDFHGNPATATAELSVFHDRDRKRFFASVMRVDRHEHGRMFTIGAGTSVTLTSTPCPRYSTKGLDTAVIRALAELRSRIDEPAIAAVGDPTSRA